MKRKPIVMTAGAVSLNDVFPRFVSAKIAEGAKIGRPQTQIDDIPQAFLRHYPAFKSGQLNMSEFARVCNLSRTTAYKYVSLLDQRKAGGEIAACL